MIVYKAPSYNSNTYYQKNRLQKATSLMVAIQNQSKTVVFVGRTNMFKNSLG